MNGGRTSLFDCSTPASHTAARTTREAPSPPPRGRTSTTSGTTPPSRISGGRSWRALIVRRGSALPIHEARRWRPRFGWTRGEDVTARREHPARTHDSVLSVVVVHPDLLGTYGDSGNGRVLANRALWRDIEVELLLVSSDVALPTYADLYCLGGGEDGPQTRSAERLADGALSSAVEQGAVVLAVCAGFQILGHHFPGAQGPVSGLGLLDVVTERGTPRAVGEVVVDAGASRLASGFENHAGRTRRGAGQAPFGTTSVGIGNGDGTDGARSGRVLGTYLHGPVLARNAWLADELLAMATGRELAPLSDEEESLLQSERLAAAGRSAGLPIGRFWRRQVRSS